MLFSLKKMGTTVCCCVLIKDLKLNLHIFVYVTEELAGVSPVYLSIYPQKMVCRFYLCYKMKCHISIQYTRPGKIQPIRYKSNTPTKPICTDTHIIYYDRIGTCLLLMNKDLANSRGNITKP